MTAATSAWTDVARATPLAAPDVKALAERLGAAPAAEVDAAADLLLERGEGEAAAALLLASAVAGRAPDAARVGRALPLVDAALAPVLVGAAQGDRVAMLCEVVGGGRVDVPRATRLLLLAAALVTDKKRPPAALVTQLRTIGRYELDIESSLAIGAAAAALDDPGVAAVCDPWIDEWRINRPPDVSVERARATLGKPVLKALPASAPRVLVGAAKAGPPKVGRNDACPCGSGKKFKKCCDGKPGAAEAPGAAKDPTAVLAAADATAFEALTPAALAALDPRRLGTLQVIFALRVAERTRAWPQVEALLAELDGRADLDAVVRARTAEKEVGAEPPIALDRTVVADDYRVDAIDAASAARELAVLRRQVALLKPEARAARPELELIVALADPSSSALSALERVALLALTAEPAAEVSTTGAPRGKAPSAPATEAAAPASVEPLSFAYALLDHAPALGILVGRGLLDPARPADSETLLDEIEHARDRLALPPEDPALDLWDLLKESSGEEDEAAPAVASDEDPTTRALRERLRAATERADALEGELGRREAEVRARPREDAAPAAPADPAEVRRLKAKVEKLEAIVAEGNDERRGLRDEATELRDALEAARAAAPALEAPAADEADDAEGEALEVDERRGALVPVWSDVAARALREAERSLQRVALRVVTALAGGEPTAWSQAKRLQAAPDLSSARVGIHHRLLFKVQAERGELHVVDLINRKALESTIRRR